MSRKCFQVPLRRLRSGERQEANTNGILGIRTLKRRKSKRSLRRMGVCLSRKMIVARRRVRMMISA